MKDSNVLDLLIGKTVSIAKENGLLKGKTIIVDATHTKSRFNQKTAKEVLFERAKRLRKSLYKIDETIKDHLPEKVMDGELEDVINYCKALTDTVKEIPKVLSLPKIKQSLNYLEEAMRDDLEALYFSEDKDARIGHKSANSKFFGYKSHLAMTEERIITGAVVTTGEANDGKELQTLIEKSKKSNRIMRSIEKVRLILP